MTNWFEKRYYSTCECCGEKQYADVMKKETQLIRINEWCYRFSTYTYWNYRGKDTGIDNMTVTIIPMNDGHGNPIVTPRHTTSLCTYDNENYDHKEEMSIITTVGRKIKFQWHNDELNRIDMYY